MGEFQLIEWIRQQLDEDDPDLSLGIGDDAAVLNLPADRELVITTDTLNSEVHFNSETSPPDLGYKALAVSLSDLAAMGARPKWVLLSVSMPAEDRLWFEAFVRGFLELASNIGVTLIGGDTCSGVLSVTVTALGLVRPGQALTRTGARAGDLVVVSGHLGDAALALFEQQGGETRDEICFQALHRPVPRIALGLSLVGKATSCIDISDGLWADLGHIAQQSGCGAIIEVARLPAGSALYEQQESKRWQLQLTGGEDYELCFTIPPQQKSSLQELSTELEIELTVIGKIVAGRGVQCVRPNGQLVELEHRGYKHFEH